MELKPMIKLKCMRARPLQEAKNVDGVKAYDKVEIHEDEALAKKVSLLIDLKFVIRMKCMKSRPLQRRRAC